MINRSEKTDAYHAHAEIETVQAGLLHETKSLEIDTTCDECDLPRLAKLAVLPGGFLKDELRKRACKLPIVRTMSMRTDCNRATTARPTISFVYWRVQSGLDYLTDT